jgi:hypothetical protein
VSEWDHARSAHTQQVCSCLAHLHMSKLMLLRVVDGARAGCCCCCCRDLGALRCHWGASPHILPPAMQRSCSSQLGIRYGSRAEHPAISIKSQPTISGTFWFWEGAIFPQPLPPAAADLDTRRLPAGARSALLGLRMLEACFELHPDSRDEILRICGARLVGAKLEDSLAYVLLLGSLTRRRAAQMHSHIPRLEVRAGVGPCGGQHQHDSCITKHAFVLTSHG